MRHRIARIDAQVEQRVLELVRIHHGEPEPACRDGLDLDRRADGAPHQVDELGHQPVDVDRLRLQGLAAREGEQAVCQRSRAAGRALAGRQVFLDVGAAALREAHADHLERARDAGEQIVEIVRQPAGQLADRLHLLRLAQRFLGLAQPLLLLHAFGDRLGDARLERLVEPAQFELGALARGHVLEQDRDLLPGCGLDPERRQLEVTAGRDQLALEADRLAGTQHVAVQRDPPVGLVRHHLAHLAPDHIGNAGIGRIGGIRLDMDVVAERTVRPVEELDDAEALVDGLERPVRGVRHCRSSVSCLTHAATSPIHARS